MENLDPDKIEDEETLGLFEFEMEFEGEGFDDEEDFGDFDVFFSADF